ncbi:MAG: glycosyltransferase family 4 protein [Lachnospiraceae bacterium]|nr:glycosyltransferase family 4 protein [Lachnospiraceae bacterium]
MAKICLVASSVFTHGGEQRVTAVIANELAKKHEIIIYTMDTEQERAANPYGLDDKIEIRYTMQPRFGMINRITRRMIRDVNEKTNLLYRNKCFYRLLEYAYFQKKWQDIWVEELSREPYDIIIGVSGSNSMHLGLIADRLNCKTIGWEHNSYEAYFETPGLYFWHMDQVFGAGAAKLDHCVVLNQYIAKRYKEAFDVDCDVIYNPRSFVSVEKSALTNKTFVGCGRIIRQKGFDLLLRSFAQFAKWNAEWKLVLVGDGEMRPELEAMIKDEGLEERVRITGYTNEVRKHLQEASIYVLSSRWEGFPMVLTEAFEMGLPVVAYDITAVEPLVTDGKQGMLAKAFDTQEFAEKMLAMTKLPREELKQMAEEAKRMAESLAIEHIIKKWEAIIEE